VSLSKAVTRRPVDPGEVEAALREFCGLGDDAARGELVAARRAVRFDPKTTSLECWRYLQATLRLAEALLRLPPEVRHIIALHRT